MLLKKSAPTSNSLRHKISIQKALLTKNNKFIKTLVIGTKRNCGRSSITGRITVRHKGGGVKNLYRIIKRNNSAYYAIIVGIVFDPNRSIFISLNFNILTKSFFYTPAINHLNPGALLICKNKSNELRLGYRLAVCNLPIGTIINNISSNNHFYVAYIKSAGTYGQLIQKSADYCKIKLPSNKVLKINSLSYATIGVLSNLHHNKIIKGKAGINRLKNKRPSVRGIAMNPVDHPHGGRTNGGFISVTPWGKVTRGKKTKKL